MIKETISNYKMYILLSALTFVGITAIKTLRNPFDLVLCAVGSLAGAFLLDLDFILNVYFLDPNSEYSKTIKTYIKHKDFKNAYLYAKHHPNNIADKTLNSAVFQVVLGGAALFTAASTSSFVTKSLIISAFINSIYRMLVEVFENKNPDSWFWALNNSPTKNSVIIYTSVLVLVVVGSFLLL